LPKEIGRKKKEVQLFKKDKKADEHHMKKKCPM
jgi:hypothetical protein